MIFYYEVAPLSRSIGVLTYNSDQNLKVGQKVKIKIKNQKEIFGVIVKTLVIQPEFETNELVVVENEFYDDFAILLAKFIASYYCSSYSQALELFHPKNSEIEICGNKFEFSDTINMSEIQQKAFEKISNENISLLFADTGSGKTEIYIKLIIENIKNNKQSLLLMPEISLTPQMQKRLELIFGSSVAIWHSKIPKKKKTEILRRVQSNEIAVIAGARSSLFLPYNSLELIIVDEEHDDSYKSDNSPRYNAKDLAIYIGSKFNKKIVLGSATPSINSYKKIPITRVEETFFKTSKAITFDESSLEITPKILKSIDNALKKNNQVIVFLPTRANFRYQICDSCGKSVECPFCSVSMSLHKNYKILKCHYCGFSAEIPQNCPICNNGIIKNFRMGTAEVKDILSSNFSDKVIEKFDTDSIKNEKELKRILNDFNDGKISILVGTQMLSKGHDYHNVTLAVVLGIDSILSLNSFRSREKAMSLLIQISGRSGRGGFGEVIIQTKNRQFFEHYLLKANYEVFLNDELSFRDPFYPPFSKIAKVYFSHNNHQIAHKNMIQAKEIGDSLNIEIVGYGECLVFKIANKYRYEMMVRSQNIKKLLEFLHIASQFGSVDMDALG